MSEDDVAKMFTSYMKYATRLYERRQLCAVCFRKELPLRGNNTTNYVEAAMRILKDQIFQRVRAYNPIQLLDFLLTRLVGYYERRLIDLANGRVDVTISRRYLPGSSRITESMVTKVESNIFEVESALTDGNKYQVSDRST